MAKQIEIGLFLNRLEIIDKRFGIYTNENGNNKWQSIPYKIEDKAESFDLFFSDGLTERKVKLFIKAVNSLCKTTISERRDKVVLTTLRADVTAYHKAIRQHYESKDLTIWCRDKFDKSPHSHIAGKLLDIKIDEKKKYRDSEDNRLEKMTLGEGGATGEGGRFFYEISDPNMIRKIGHALLSSKNKDDRKRFLNMVLGLMCLTGRRATEVLLMTVGIASLTPVKDRKNVMLFHGQLKNEHALNPVNDYHIYVLADNKLIISKIIELQEMVKNPAVDTLPILSSLDFEQYDSNDFVKLEINDRLNRALGRRQKIGESGNTLTSLARNARFGEFLNESNGTFNPKDFKAKQLRAMYVALSYYFFVYKKGIKKQMTTFGSNLLGHTEGKAIDHYSNYQIKDVPMD
jgi:hypothetical protein